MNLHLVSGVVLGLTASVLHGVPADGQQLSTPPAWRWRLERPARLVTEQDVPDSAWRFVSMPPGFHVTTGPGVVLFDPRERVTGSYSISADFLLFPRPSAAGYGLVVGGDDLSATSGRYLAIQLRRDGAVRVAAFAAGREVALAPWTVHAAVKPHTGSGVVANRLRVSVAPDSLRVFVNDSAVVAVSATGLATDGQFGLQVGEQLNFHITTFDLIRHLAPGRR